jgi:hypothetical protein
MIGDNMDVRCDTNGYSTKKKELSVRQNDSRLKQTVKTKILDVYIYSFINGSTALFWALASSSAS